MPARVSSGVGIQLASPKQNSAYWNARLRFDPWVVFPPGDSLVDNLLIDIPAGHRVTGTPGGKSRLIVTYSGDSTAASSVLRCGDGCIIDDLEIWTTRVVPGQDLTATLATYPWSIHGNSSSDARISNIRIGNMPRGINFVGVNGTIENVTGFPAYIGLETDSNGNTLNLKNIRWNDPWMPNFNSDGLVTWQKANGIGFNFKGVAGLFAETLFAFDYNIGINAIQGTVGGQAAGPEGLISVCRVEGCNTAVEVDFGQLSIDTGTFYGGGSDTPVIHVNSTAGQGGPQGFLTLTNTNCLDNQTTYATPYILLDQGALTMGGVNYLPFANGNVGRPLFLRGTLGDLEYVGGRVGGAQAVVAVILDANLHSARIKVGGLRNRITNNMQTSNWEIDVGTR